MSNLNSFAKYTALRLAEKVNGRKPIKGEPLWTQGKAETFGDRIGEAVFGKVIWTWWKYR